MSVNDFQLTETPLLSRSSVGRAEELRSDAAALTTGWADALLLRVNSRGGQVKVSPEGQLVFAEATELGGPEPVRGAVFLGIRENRHVWAVRVSLLAGTLSELRMLGGTLDDADAGLLTGAVAILNWHDSAGFSAIDGAPSEPTMSGWSRISTSTGHEEFPPRTDPAVICLVHDGGDRVLLARQPTWPQRRFSILAGFVEAGGVTRNVCCPRDQGRSRYRRAQRSIPREPALAVPSLGDVGFAAIGDPPAAPLLFADGEIAEGTWFTKDEVRAALELGDWGSEADAHCCCPGRSPSLAECSRAGSSSSRRRSTDQSLLDLVERRVGRNAAVAVLHGRNDVIATVDAADEIGCCRIVLDVDLGVLDPRRVELRLEATAVAAPRGRVDGQGRRIFGRSHGRYNTTTESVVPYRPVFSCPHTVGRGEWSVGTSCMMVPMPADTGLDPEQSAAVLAPRGPVCVLAGAGTGKTRTITRRIAHLVADGHVSAGQVLAVTFTARAAGEMRGRLRELGVGGSGPQVQARTFHAAALRQLKYFWPQVVGDTPWRLLDRKFAVVSSAAARVGLSTSTESVRDLASEIEWSKASLIAPEDYPRAIAKIRREAPVDATKVAQVYAAYEELKARGQDGMLLDFDDLLLHTAAALEEHSTVADEFRERYRCFVVDEYQDVTPPLQQRVLDAWLGDRDDLTVVGDANQTIYSFTGATPPNYLLDFSRKFPRSDRRSARTGLPLHP